MDDPLWPLTFFCGEWHGLSIHAECPWQVWLCFSGHERIQKITSAPTIPSNCLKLLFGWCIIRTQSSNDDSHIMTKRLLLTISLKTEFRSLVQNLNFDDFYDRPDEKKSLNGPLVPSSPYTGNMDQRKIKKKIKKTRKKKTKKRNNKRKTNMKSSNNIWFIKLMWPWWGSNSPPSDLKFEALVYQILMPYQVSCAPEIRNKNKIIHCIPACVGNWFAQIP